MTVPGLWRLYSGWLSWQIRFSTFLELYVTTLACKLYSSCPCCVIIKLRVPVYSVRVGISLDSLVKLAVCRFISYAYKPGGFSWASSPWGFKHYTKYKPPGWLKSFAKKNKTPETGIFAVFSAFHMVKIYVFFLILLMAITVYSTSILLILQRRKFLIKS